MHHRMDFLGSGVYYWSGIGGYLAANLPHIVAQVGEKTPTLPNPLPGSFTDFASGGSVALVAISTIKYLAPILVKAYTDNQEAARIEREQARAERERIREAEQADKERISRDEKFKIEHDTKFQELQFRITATEDESRRAKEEAAKAREQSKIDLERYRNRRHDHDNATNTLLLGIQTYLRENRLSVNDIYTKLGMSPPDELKEEIRPMVIVSGPNDPPHVEPSQNILRSSTP